MSFASSNILIGEIVLSIEFENYQHWLFSCGNIQPSSSATTYNPNIAIGWWSENGPRVSSLNLNKVTTTNGAISGKLAPINGSFMAIGF